MKKKITSEDFDRILADIMNENSASSLLQVPGVYEVVSEYFNNDVLATWVAEQETEEDCDEE